MFGALIERRPFYHFWHKARALGLKPRPELFSLENAMAFSNRFIFPTNALGVAQHMRYALHIDLGLAARYLRGIAERAGVIRLERKVVSATRREDGCLEELKFEDGGTLRADLFVDCTGARAQLIGEILETPFEALEAVVALRPHGGRAGRARRGAPAVLCALRRARRRLAVAHATAAVASAGQVYASEFQDDEAARLEFVEAAGDAAERAAHARASATAAGAALGRTTWSPSVARRVSSSRWWAPTCTCWPMALFNLLDHFPDRQFDACHLASLQPAMGGADLDASATSSSCITALRGATTRRSGSSGRSRRCPTRCSNASTCIAPADASLQVRPELFTDLDWFWIFEGAGVIPRDYDPLVDTIDFEQVKRVMLAVSQKISADVAAAPTHDSFFAAANARLAGARKAAAAAAAFPRHRRPRQAESVPQSAKLLAGVELGGTKCVCILGSGPDDVRAIERLPTGEREHTLRQIEARAGGLAHAARRIPRARHCVVRSGRPAP